MAAAGLMPSSLPTEIHAIYRAGGFDPATLDGLAEVLGADRMRHLLQITRTEFAEALTRLRRAATAKDLERTRSEAHALRGAAANIGAVTLAGAVERYEGDLRGGIFSPTLFGAIDDAVAVADAALAKLDPGN